VVEAIVVAFRHQAYFPTLCSGGPTLDRLMKRRPEYVGRSPFDAWFEMTCRLDAAERLLDDAVNAKTIEPSTTTKGALQLLRVARRYRGLLEAGA
jgi:hypothetical protein